MRDAILLYFGGEKLGGLLVAAIGLTSLVAGVVLYQARFELRPLAITFVVVSLLEMGLGIGLFVRAAPQVARLEAQLASDAPAFHATEGARMTRVQKNFVVLEIVWVVIHATSALAAILAKSRPTVLGIALGLLLHAAFFLAFDLIAERRGAVYLARIHAWSP